MCKHRYKDYESLPKDKQFCRLKEYIEDSKNLPIDNNGFCIFHSQDLQWKKEQDFVQWLSLLKDGFTQKNEYAYFLEIHFVGEKGKQNIDYLHLLSDSDLQDCTLHEMLFCEDQSINGNLDFRRCTLFPVMRFSNCDFYGELQFTSIHVTDGLEIPLMIFRDCRFHSTFYYVYNLEVKMNFSFSKCEFDAVQMEDFSNEKEYGSFDFTQCDVKVLDMKNCIIYNPDFTKTIFHTAEFYNVAFKEETVFDGIQVNSNLNFLGGANHYIFEGVTRFDVDFKEIQGNIYFENASISSFLKSHKEALLDFEKRENGKVVIGSGCIKYRVMSDDKVYKIKDFHHHFITEIGHSFSNFFTQYNGFNLGIEVRSKTKKDITIFYFTDDDINKPEFNELINTTSERIFGVESPISKESSIQKDAYVNFQIDLIRSLTKIAYQIQKSNWKFNDSKAFLSALNLSPNIYLDQKSTHAFLKNINVNDFLQTVKNLSITINQEGNDNKFVGVVNTDKMINKNNKR